MEILISDITGISEMGENIKISLILFYVNKK